MRVMRKRWGDKEAKDGDRAWPGSAAGIHEEAFSHMASWLGRNETRIGALSHSNGLIVPNFRIGKHESKITMSQNHMPFAILKLIN